MKLTLILNEKEAEHLHALLETGLYGPSIEQAALRLLDRGLERELTEGILWKPEEENDRGF